MAVVKTHERHLHEACVFIEQSREIVGIQRAVTRLPQASLRRLGGIEPRGGAGGEIEIGDHHFIVRSEVQGVGEEIVRLRTARAERHFLRLQADHACGDFTAGFHGFIVRHASAHAEALVARVLRQCLVHAHRRNALGGGVQISHVGQGGEIVVAAFFG